MLAQYLGDIDGRQDAWNGRDQGDGYKFKVLTTGRVGAYILHCSSAASNTKLKIKGLTW